MNQYKVVALLLAGVLSWMTIDRLVSADGKTQVSPEIAKTYLAEVERQRNEEIKSIQEEIKSRPREIRRLIRAGNRQGAIDSRKRLLDLKKSLAALKKNDPPYTLKLNPLKLSAGQIGVLDAPELGPPRGSWTLRVIEVGHEDEMLVACEYSITTMRMRRTAGGHYYPSVRPGATRHGPAFIVKGIPTEGIVDGHKFKPKETFQVKTTRGIASTVFLLQVIDVPALAPKDSPKHR